MAMNGYKYERYCARYLKKQGFHRISLTPKSGDQGIDIIAHKKFRKYGFQCKYYASPVGNKAVQEAYSGAAFYGCDHAGVITNSTFTPAAAELAEKTDVILWDGVKPGLFNRIKLFFSRLSVKLSIFFLCVAAVIITVIVKKYDGSVSLAYGSFIYTTGLDSFPFFRFLPDRITEYLVGLLVIAVAAEMVLMLYNAMRRRKNTAPGEEKGGKKEPENQNTKKDSEKHTDNSETDETPPVPPFIKPPASDGFDVDFEQLSSMLENNTSRKNFQ